VKEHARQEARQEGRQEARTGKAGTQEEVDPPYSMPALTQRVYLSTGSFTWEPPDHEIRRLPTDEQPLKQETIATRHKESCHVRQLCTKGPLPGWVLCTF
jgi:hypothetical protein